MLLLLHGGVGQLLPVDDQVGVVGGLQGEAPVADATAVALLLVLLHDVLQVLPAFGKRQLEAKTGESDGRSRMVSLCLALTGSVRREINANASTFVL